MSSPEVNWMLASLSAECLRELLSLSSSVPMPLKMSLYEPERRPEFAYFLTEGLASIVTTTEDGDTAEVGIIGLEGVVGSLHLLGPALVSTNGFMQIEGAGIRVPLEHLQRLFDGSEEIRGRVLEFVQEQTLTVSQLAACNRLHDVEARLARWLLAAQDRTQVDVLKLTQEFLGMMLASRRTTVTLVAGTFQRLGLIQYSRGRVRIVNRAGLEEVACDCYQVTKRLQAGLYQGQARTVMADGRMPAHFAPLGPSAQ
jgi:CRP-like cAMP-binding protein